MAKAAAVQYSQVRPIEHLGATAVPMALSEVMPALQSGNIDGLIAGIPVLTALKFYDAAKAVTEIEIRSGALATAGGLVFTALQDGWIVAYNDETLEELWRFNVGTPLKGAPVTYAIGPKQYLAVQAGGRHLHPINWDKLENSSYLFVFALN